MVPEAEYGHMYHIVQIYLRNHAGSYLGQHLVIDILLQTARAAVPGAARLQRRAGCLFLQVGTRSLGPNPNLTSALFLGLGFAVWALVHMARIAP